MKKYKIVVLSDLGKSTSTALKSSISLAKMINGDIEIFSVKKPTDIIGKENQLSAMRTLNDEHTVISKKLQTLTAKASKDYDIDIKYSFSFGNVKNEIEDFIKDRRPDIVVLGKRITHPLNFIGDGITPFVLNIFKGAIMIGADKNALEPNKEISLGMLNCLESSFNLEFAENLMANIQRPLKSFKILRNSTSSEVNKQPANKNNVEYVFEHNDSSIKNLSNYLSKNKVDLLYVDRLKKPDNKMVTDVKDAVNNLNVTILLTGENSPILQ